MINCQTVFYSLSFLIFLQTVRLHYDLVINVFDLSNYGYFLEFRYLTVWCMALHFVYYSMQFITNFLFRNSHLPRLLNYFRTAIVFPVGMFVPMVFWGIYMINPYLLVSKRKLEITPAINQHTLHTAPMIFQLLEPVFVRTSHKFSKKSVFTGQILFQILFTANMFYFRGIMGKFPYPVLDKMWQKNEWYVYGAAAVCIFPMQGLKMLCEVLSRKKIVKID